MEDSKMMGFIAILKKLEQLVPAVAGNDAELARVFNVTRTAPSQWRKRDCIPLKNLVSFAREYKINIHWLITGEGQMNIEPLKTATTPLITDESTFTSEYKPSIERVFTALPETKNSDAAIARAFDVNRTTPATWRKRNTLPAENLVKLALKFNINMKWLFTGKGDMYEHTNHVAPAEPVKAFPPDDVKQAIKEQGYTLSMLAEALDVNLATVSNVILGNSRSRRIAESIAKLIGEPLEVVFPDVEAYAYSLFLTPEQRTERVTALKQLLAS
ncbi:MAG: hypothetical protein CML20_19410 [Rheinheimera sp.]|nr:hypothetical protein [Rheinheimera sp.]